MLAGIPQPIILQERLPRIGADVGDARRGAGSFVEQCAGFGVGRKRLAFHDA